MRMSASLEQRMNDFITILDVSDIARRIMRWITSQMVWSEIADANMI